MSGKVMTKGSTSALVAANIKHMRQLRDWSLQSFAAKVTRAGWPLTHDAMWRIETGRRRIDVDDLVAIASALGVPPETLLFWDVAEWGFRRG